MEPSVQWRDIAERIFWTFVAGFLGALTASPLAQALGMDLSLTALQSAFVAGVAAVATFVLALARWRLSVLPDPGAAVIEATARETYRQIDVGSGGLVDLPPED